MPDEALFGSIGENEEERDPGLRPDCLDDFVGQEEIKTNLRIYIRAARGRKDNLDHVLLSGPPGLGKTTLAFIMANELGVEIKVTSAPALDKPKDIVGLLTSLNKNAILFIDEIHRLKPVIEEILYIAMEDYEIDWIIGQGPGARSVRIPLPPFTLIGATTKAGSLSSPLHSRFGITARLDFYETRDIRKIIGRSARLLEVVVEDAAAELLASCSRGTPRVANRLLRRMRDFAQIEGMEAKSEGTVTKGLVGRSLTRMGIDSYGLEKQDRVLLQTIIEKYDGGPVGAETLAITLGESVDTLEDLHEPYLIQQGFLNRTPRGRVVTDAAYRILGIDKAIENAPSSADDENQRLLF